MVRLPRGADDTFPYVDSQLNVLYKITTIVTSISLVASVLVVVFYALFMRYERKKADRVSLRCVALGTLFNVIDTVLDIGSSVGQAPQPVCRAIGLIVDFTDVLDAGFLSVIGINLFLVFVIKIKRTERLEWIYYPLIVLYSIIAVIGPIVQESKNIVPNNPEFSCWYYNHIGYRERHFVGWMCYYGFIFLIILLGLIGSLCAMIKLFREEASNFKIIRHITANAHILNNNGGKPSSIQKPRSQQAYVPKIIIRCITYTLVPLLVNIWGFCIQILVLAKKPSPYGLTIVTALMASAEGLLTSMIFFSEPVIVTYIKEKMTELYRTYGEEFSVLVEYAHKNGTTVRKQRYQERRPNSLASSREMTDITLRSGHTSGTQCISNLFDKRNLIPRPAIAEKGYPPFHNQHLSSFSSTVSHVDLGGSHYGTSTLAPPETIMSPIRSVGSISTSSSTSPTSTTSSSSSSSHSPPAQRTRSPSLTSSPTLTSSIATVESIGSFNSIDDESYHDNTTSEIRTIPVRRVSVSSSVYSRIRTEYERRLSEGSTASTLVNHPGLGRNLVPSTDTPDQIFIPYRSPALARATHWLLVNIDRLRGHARGNNSSNEQQQEQEQYDTSDGDMSLIPTNSHLSIQSYPEVIVHSPSMQSNASTVSS